MINNSNRHIPNLIYYSAVVLPYVVVALGLYGFRNAWVAIGGYHLGMMILLAIFYRRQPRSQSHSAIDQRYLTALSLGGSLLSGILVFYLWPWLAKLPRDELVPFLMTWALTPSNWPIFVLYFCLVNPWLEEIYWRNWLGQTKHSIWETSLWFAGYHSLVLLPILQAWAIFLVIVILLTVGWWWSMMRQHGGGLFGPILYHTVADVSVMTAVTLLSNII